ncbi:MAG: sulfatase family protein [Myxococcota bacterium]
MRARVPHAHRPIVLLVALAIASSLGCGRGAGERRTNVLLISLDTVRADHTSLLGYDRETTPRLVQLGREGAVFTDGYTMTSTTGPTHATLFTGRYAPAHGVARNGVSLAASATTLAEHLAARGYRTAGFASSFVLAARFGFAQGFGFYDDRFDREGSSLPQPFWEGHAVPGRGFDRAGDRTTERALAWLESQAGQGGPFFLFVHYFDAHEPYAPLPDRQRRLAAGGEPAASAEIDRYDGEILFVDDQVGRLLDALDDLGLAESTLVFVTSDHGQGLTDHNDAFHSVNVYEESVRGVFVFRGPGVAPGVRSRAPVQHVDVVPTILDLLARGSQRSLNLPGRSLVPELAGGDTIDPERPVYVYRQLYPGPRVLRGTPVDGEQHGVRIGDWKYIEGTRDGVRELYDLSRDPGERNDLSEAEPEKLRELSGRLAAWRSTLGTTRAAAPALSVEERKKLQALGYLEAE